MLTATDIGELIKQCAAHHVMKFQAGPDGTVSFTFSGYREPAEVAASAMEQALTSTSPWFTQHIPPAPLPPEVE